MVYDPEDILPGFLLYKNNRLFIQPVVFATVDQAWAGAPTGHVSAQAPHSMQASGLISYFPSPSLIAETGHSAAHAPQLMHSSEIL